MIRKFICLINPISGTKNKEAVLKLIENKTAKAGFTIQMLHTNKEGNYDALIETIKTESITDIIICGGDGTVNQVAGALQGIDISIGIIPMGSGNGLARTAGISSSPAKAMNTILKGSGKIIDAFYLNGRFCCMLAGLGMDAQVAHDFALQPERGLKTYFKQTLKQFFIAPAYPFVIKSDGKELHTDAFFISIANSNQFGNNVTIAPKASLSDGLLDIVVVKKMGKAGMIYKVVMQLLTGRPVSFSNAIKSKNDVLYFQAGELSISNPGKAPLHIDGDPAATEENFQIKIIEKAFRLLQP